MEHTTPTTQRRSFRRRAVTLYPPVAEAQGKSLLARVWFGRGALGGSVAIGLAFLGQLAQLGDDESAAGRYYLAAIGLLLVSLTHFAPSHRDSTSTPSNTLPTRVARAHTVVAEGESNTASYSIWSRYTNTRRVLGLRATGAGLVVTALLGALSVAVLAGNVASPVGGWLWVASMLALTATFLGVAPRPGQSLLPAPGSDFFRRGIPILGRRAEWSLFGAVLVAGIALRLYDLEYHPGIFGDEGERGMDARGINNGDTGNIFGYGWWNVPRLYFYCVAWMLRIFGDNMVGARMLSVLSGIVALVFIYRTGKLLWGQRAGLIAMSLLAVSPLALQFSRQASESSPTGALWAAGFFYFFKALHGRRYSDWVLSGTLLSFSMYFYASGKLVVVLIAAALAYCLLLWRWRFVRLYGWGAFLMLLSFGLTFLPNAIVNVQDRWMRFAWRSQETAIFSQTLQDQTFARYNIPFDHAWTFEPLPSSLLHHITGWALLLYNQVRVSLEALYKIADPTAFYQIRWHNGTMLSPLFASIALLGIAYAAWKLPDARFALVSIYFWGGLLGTALTIDTPTVQRLTGAWPALMLFPAALLDRIAASAWPLSIAAARKWSAAPAAALLIFFGVTGYQEYFEHYASLCPYCKATTQARYAQSLGQEYKAYQLAEGDGISFGYGSTRFAAKDVEGVDVAAPAATLPVTDNKGKGLAFLVYPSNAQYLPLLRYFYPDGKEERIIGGDGQEYFVSYKVPREAMSRYQAAQATYTWGDAQIERIESSLGTAPVWVPPPGVIYPVQATWNTNLFAPTYGGYIFSINGGENTHLEIDGRPVNSTTAGNPATVLARGLHHVFISTTLKDASARLEVKLAGKSLNMGAIPSSLLFTGRTGGLWAEVWRMTSLEAFKSGLLFSANMGPEELRMYPAVGFKEAAASFNNQPFTLRWQGTLNAPKRGSYIFNTNTNGPCILRIDRQIVIDNTTDGSMSTASGMIELAAGQHSLEMRTMWGGGTAPMELYWSTPGETSRLIPPSALSPEAVEGP